MWQVAQNAHIVHKVISFVCNFFFKFGPSLKNNYFMCLSNKILLKLIIFLGYSPRVIWSFITPLALSSKLVIIAICIKKATSSEIDDCLIFLISLNLTLWSSYGKTMLGLNSSFGIELYSRNMFRSLVISVKMKRKRVAHAAIEICPTLIFFCSNCCETREYNLYVYLLISLKHKEPFIYIENCTVIE